MMLKTLFKILKTKFIFFPERNIDTLILDYQTSYFYEKFFRKKIILCTRGEKYYFSIFLKSLVNWLLNSNSMTFNQIYILNCIKVINPKNILSFTDYNIFFLNLKNFFPEKKLVIIQSHARSFRTLKEINNEKKVRKFIIDYIFIWGEKYKDYYKKFTNSKFIVSGNIKNNYFKDIFSIKKNSLVIVSQFRYNQNQQNYWFQSGEAENFKKKVFKIIQEFSKKNDLKLYVLANYVSKNKKIYQNEEFLYFKKILKKDFIFLEKKKYIWIIYKITRIK